MTLDQIEARSMLDTECLAAGIAAAPTHVVRVTGHVWVATYPADADAINAWLDGRLSGATWVRWRRTPGEDVIATTDRHGAAVLAAWEQFGSTAALRLIAMIDAMPTEEEPHG